MHSYIVRREPAEPSPLQRTGWEYTMHILETFWKTLLMLSVQAR